MIEAVTTGVNTVIGWMGEVVTAFLGDTGALKQLLPLFAIGIAISAILFAIKGIKSLIWGA